MGKRTVILVMALLLPALAACGGQGGTASGTPTLKAGMLDFNDYEKASFTGWLTDRLGDQGAGLAPAIYYDSLTGMSLALNAGKIDYMSVPDITAAYLAERNAELSKTEGLVTYGLQMAVLPERAQLRDRLSEAISALRDDGTLDELARQWIEDLPVGGEPAAGKPPSFAGAETIKVGVTGDLPPLDYVSADGQPGGYNVALLSAIGNELGVNIELVPVACGARAAALGSGAVDALFWLMNCGETDSDVTNGELLVTVAYYTGVLDLVTLNRDTAQFRKQLGLDELAQALVF